MRRKRAAAYIRVSHDEQVLHGFSLRAQREELDNYAKEHNLNIIEYYTDEGISARTKLGKRREMQNLLRDLKILKIDVVIFIKLDRWFRSVADYYKVQEILESNNVAWIATQENYDTTTRDGRLKVNLMLTIAQDESDRISERIKFVNQSKLKHKGVLSGAQPFGYMVGLVDGEKRVVKSPDHEQIINDVFEHYATHNSKNATVKYINNKYGHNTISYNRITTVLTGTMYYGFYKGIPDYAPAYITHQQYLENQKRIKNNIKRRKYDRIFLFSGMVKCPECGLAMAGTGSGNDYHYYRCSHNSRGELCKNNKRVIEHQLEKYMLENIESELEDYIYDVDVEHGEPIKTTVDKEELEAETKRLNYQFQKNRITLEHYENEMSNIESILDKMDKPEELPNLQKHKDFLMRDFRSIYDDLDREGKQAVWLSIVSKIQVYIIEPDSKKYGFKIEFKE